MAEPDFAEVDVALGWCGGCGREVLTWLDYSSAHTPTAAELELHRCLHCEQVVTSQLRRAKGADLAQHGYRLVEASGCGSGGCGSGKCGRPARPGAGSD
jgi:hypothetical protein